MNATLTAGFCTCGAYYALNTDTLVIAVTVERKGLEFDRDAYANITDEGITWDCPFCTDTCQEDYDPS